MTRSEAREQAFILVFEKIFNPEVTLADMKDIARESGEFEIDEFTERLALAVFDNEEECDGIIEGNLKAWKLSRLPKVSLAILRTAVAEIMYFDDVPDSVSANEAVNLAKKYGGDGDSSFINGLLGSVIRAKK